MFVGTVNFGELGQIAPYIAEMLRANYLLKLFPRIQTLTAPDLIFTAAEIAAVNSVFGAMIAKPKVGANQSASKAQRKYIDDKLAAWRDAAPVGSEEAKRRKQVYLLWNPPDANTFQKFLIAAAAIATAGALASAISAGAFTGGAAGGGTGLTAGAAGGGLSPWAGSVLGLQPATIGASVGSGLVATAGGNAIAATALAALKKYAIDYGVEYAMGKAAEYYATQQQKKMEAAQEKALQQELEAAKAEYEKLLAAGATPEAAASQAVAKPDTIPVALIAGVALLALLILRK